MERREPPCKFAGASLWLRTHVCVCVCAEGSIDMCEQMPAVQTTRRARPLQRESRGGPAPAVPFTSCAPIGPAFDASAPEGGWDTCGSLTARPGVHLCLPPPASWGPFWSFRPGKGPSVPLSPFSVPGSPHLTCLPPRPLSPLRDVFIPKARDGAWISGPASEASPPGPHPSWVSSLVPLCPQLSSCALCAPEWPGHPLGLEFPALDDASVSRLPQAPPSTHTGPAGGSVPLCGRAPSSRARRSEEGSRLSGEGLSRCPADSASP